VKLEDGDRQVVEGGRFEPAILRAKGKE